MTDFLEILLLGPAFLKAQIESANTASTNLINNSRELMSKNGTPPSDLSVAFAALFARR
jgi:hypothetical protein